MRNLTVVIKVHGHLVLTLSITLFLTSFLRILGNRNMGVRPEAILMVAISAKTAIFTPKTPILSVLASLRVNPQSIARCRIWMTKCLHTRVSTAYAHGNISEFIAVYCRKGAHIPTLLNADFKDLSRKW